MLSVTQYMESNDWLFSEYWIGIDVEGSGRDVTIPEFSWRTRDNHKNLREFSVSGPISEPKIPEY
jgi:hypothetical protein